ncbi:MAG: ABC transporter ATP-binding protein [Anaerolineales bacterium]|nr:ABC transporter ATP-binding protein [Anaerolineales bacterium]
MQLISEPISCGLSKEYAAVRLDGVSLHYHVPRERMASIKEYAIRKIKGRLEYSLLRALDSINLEIFPGEVFGIVGANGAGKSTLLKIIAGVLQPGKGRVRVNGSVAPLLELGAGFHPELTGRENVFLYGALLGYSRQQMRSCFDSIVDFSELYDFIEAPLRTYSTGMAARLAFAVATVHFAEVLLIDEVLSVGDMAFQKKCQQRIEQFRTQGAAVVFVSHSAEKVTELCRRAGWISHGRLQLVGEACKVVLAYQQQCELPIQVSLEEAHCLLCEGG